MAPYVWKIKYGETLRRITVEASLLDNGPDMTFDKLQETIRQAFKIPASSALSVTYTDKDNDVVTIAGDHDIHDACVFQGLNPLRLNVTVTAQESDRPGPHGHRKHGHQHGRPQNSQEANNFPDFKNLLSNTLKMSQEQMAQVFQSLSPSAVLAREDQPEYPMGPPPPPPHFGQSGPPMPPMPPHFGQGGDHPMPPPPQSGETEHPMGIPPPFSSSDHPMGPPQSGQGDHPMPPPPHFGSQFPGFPSLPSHPFLNFPPFHCYAPEPPAPDSAGPSGDKDQTNPTEEGKDAVQHRGVQCDECGMVPIVGTRYKSNKKKDYDLCQKCFQELGSAEDYTQIERPVWRPRHCHPHFAGGRMMRGPAMPPPFGARPPFHMRGPHGFHGPYGGRGDCRWGPAPGGKLDARFVKDVTIFDGTELAPGTAFTKIWRLRNSGATTWPQATQFIRVGGDDLGSVSEVTVELPEEGLAPEGEVEVSVDLVAPGKPGRYVSHWRLMSPTGQKFGHRVWVLIQVVPKDDDSPQVMESLKASQEDMEMPEQEAPVKNSHQAMETDALAQQQTGDQNPTADVDIRDSEAVAREPQVEVLMLEPERIETEGQEETAAVESSELGNFSMVNIPFGSEVSQLDGTESAATPLVTEVEVGSAETNSVDAMLGTLDSMGFKQKDLNVELLKKNEYDMQRTLDDLVTAAEWEPMLKELEEMGFYDTDMNRRLMFKNNGSVKRVVKELVQMYKASKGKEQN